MAERVATITGADFFPGDTLVITWAGLLNGDHGNAVRLPHSGDKSVQVLGTLGAGGNCQIQGSNVPAASETFASTDFVTLTDPQGNALDVNTLKIEQVMENSLRIRPKITAGDGTTNLTVQLVVRRGK